MAANIHSILSFPVVLWEKGHSADTQNKVLIHSPLLCAGGGTRTPTP
ncbi:MAG: hypothetical protein AAGJ93_06785 [Bacteroidota bacterium]